MKEKPDFTLHVMFIQMIDHFWKHWSPMMNPTYLNDVAHWILLLTGMFMFFAVIMRFLVAITADALKASNGQVPVQEQKQKVQFILKVIEIRRMLACKKKAASPYLNMDGHEPDFESALAKRLATMPQYRDFAYLKRGEDPNPADNYMYTVVEVSDKEVANEKPDPDIAWIGSIEKSLNELYTMVETFETNDKNDEKFALIENAILEGKGPGDPSAIERDEGEADQGDQPEEPPMEAAPEEIVEVEVEIEEPPVEE